MLESNNFKTLLFILIFFFSHSIISQNDLLDEIDYNNEDTLEDENITEPKEREKLYWQSDHLRLFGRDYGDKLAAAGFKVTESNYINEIDPNLVKRYALDKNEIVV